jgi:DNA-binding MarR family transcriptional regulator/N-acetylglutamate synthase-like GNAT family acetyltransferase
MKHDNPSLIADVRAASRDLVREFGLMNRTVAGTDLSVSAAHAIIEIGNTGGLSSKDLAERLVLEKSTVSRLVKSLIAKDEIREVRSKGDARVKYLHLTRRGAKTLRAIDAFAEDQVSGALNRLNDRAQQRVLKGLQDYSAALNAAAAHHPGPPGEATPRSGRIEIKAGFDPQLAGRIVEMLGPYMDRHMGFGVAFENRISADIAEFLSRIGSPQNETWRAELGGKIVGGISIDGQDLGAGLAHLRWFIVGDEARGRGAGRTLLAQALDYCDRRGFQETHLWTVKGLDAARGLYENNGFILADEYTGDQWGAEVLEQKFVRLRPS